MDEILNLNTLDKKSVKNALLMYRINLEYLIVKINHESNLYDLKIKICICTPTLIGDRYDGSNHKVYMYVYIYVYIYIYIYMFVYMYIYVYGNWDMYMHTYFDWG
jgi:hypothetical protein